MIDGIEKYIGTDYENTDTDGEEDKNRNGKLDDGESDPTDFDSIPSDNTGFLIFDSWILYLIPLMLLFAVLILLILRKRKKSRFDSDSN